MQFSSNTTLLQYLDTSLVLVVADLSAMLAFTAFHELRLQRNGIEVIVVSQSELIDDVQVLTEAYPKINWVILGNDSNIKADTAHAINIAVSNASSKYILVADTGMRFHTDIIYQFRYLIHHYPNSFATCTAGEEHTCLMLEKAALDDAGGWPKATSAEESVRTLSYTLEKIGWFGMMVTQAKILVAEKKEYIASNTSPVISRRYHWRNNKSSRYRNDLLERFSAFKLKEDEYLFDNHYSIICLIQVRNEIKHLPDVIEHVGNHCDGIILLDDESSDGSYEAAVGEKLLLKATKNNNGCFDDLENRNLLLQMGHLFKCDAMFFLDADERLDPKFADVRSQLTENRPDTILFYVVHLWNNREDYRVDVPLSMKGLLLRYRLFMNRGYMQIISHKLLHFPAVPYIVRTRKSPVAILVRHYGLMEESTRKWKFQRYNQQDIGGKMQGHDYAYLLDEKIHTAKVSDIVLQGTVKN